MKSNKKYIFYGILGLMLFITFLVLKKIFSVLLAPVGFTIVAVESYGKVKDISLWKSISTKQKITILWNIFFLIIILIFVVLLTIMLLLQI